jgi:hypothetical protein
MKNITTSIFILLFIVVNTAFAAPVVSIPTDLTVEESDNTIDIPVYISDVSSYDIAGYILRLDYSDELSNPQLITDDTLSQGKEERMLKAARQQIALVENLPLDYWQAFHPKVTA